MDSVPQSRPRVKNVRILRERIEKYISPIYFSDINLFSKLYCHSTKIDSASHYSAPGRISFEEATNCNEFKQVNVAQQSFGPTWSTHWFRLDINLSVNSNWKGKEVRLRWNSGSEAMVWQDGKPMQGLTGGDGQIRTDYILTNSCNGDEQFLVYIEMAANGMFGAGNNGMIQPPDPDKYFSVSMMEISTLDLEVYGIIRDLKIIIDMVNNLPEDSNLAQHALQVGCDVVNCCQAPLTTSYEKAEKMLDSFFRSSVQCSSRYQFNIHAIGHCHIDTAWLWPYAETQRKCARSWSSIIGLMKRYPEFKFACSQAVQLDWVKSKYPSLYSEIKRYASLGRFNYTGGTWVEMDGNVPSGEAFVRQFLYGQRFFKKEFGSYCQVFWLPDTFGYSAQLPQIMRQSGIKYFLTQKLSWSLINKFPHNSFIWQGIDGSQCLAHFPPADTYESPVDVKDIFKTCNQNKEKGVVSDGMLLYGYGDGGGGPTEDMIESLNRMRHIDGFPGIHHTTPVEFYNILEKSSHLLHTWAGELYLELHQGTFTSQAWVKRYNRKREMALRTAEFFQVWAYLEYGGLHEEIARSMDIEQIWKKVLLNQFHDVLPGTAINEVYKDAWKLYEEVKASCSKWNEIHLKILANGECFQGSASDELVFNTSAWARKGIFLLSCDRQLDKNVGTQLVHCLNGETFNAVMVDLPSMGVSNVSSIQSMPSSPSPSIHCDALTGIITMSNEHLSAQFNSAGQLVSCVLLENKRECIHANAKGNQFCIFTDIPLFWDAWDVMPYNGETKAVLDSCSKINIINKGPLRVSFEFSLKISDDSSLTQIVSLDVDSKFLQFDTEVQWHENRKMLKVEFPFNVLTQHATFEIQYGYLQRPTHCNTSWDWAKHEVCGHKWVDVSEYGFGIALLNDCKYGFSAYGSTLQMSLLRSPKAPDSEADMGSHSFSYALMPYTGNFQSSQVIRHAYDFNNPMECLHSYKVPNKFISLFQVSNEAVILDTIKLCDQENCIIIRLYESFGSHVEVTLTSHYKMLDVFRVNVLEERYDLPSSQLLLVDDHSCSFSLSPFELFCLCIQIK